MKRALAAVATLFVGWRLYCALRGRHEPVRQLIGGQRCADCGKAAADLDGLGFGGSDRVSLNRPKFERGEDGRHTTTREYQS